MKDLVPRHHHGAMHMPHPAPWLRVHTGTEALLFAALLALLIAKVITSIDTGMNPKTWDTGVRSPNQTYKYYPPSYR